MGAHNNYSMEMFRAEQQKENYSASDSIIGNEVRYDAFSFTLFIYIKEAIHKFFVFLNE